MYVSERKNCKETKETDKVSDYVRDTKMFLLETK